MKKYLALALLALALAGGVAAFDLDQPASGAGELQRPELLKPPPYGVIAMKKYLALALLALALAGGVAAFTSSTRVRRWRVAAARAAELAAKASAGPRGRSRETSFMEP